MADRISKLSTHLFFYKNIIYIRTKYLEVGVGAGTKIMK